MIIADLHIHSKHSRGCSSNLDIDSLEKYSRIKGIGLLGTGDFTHPKWIEELKSKLTQTENEGIYQTKSGFKFICQTEISLIYSQGGRGRRIHNIVLAPNLEAAAQITDMLKKKGRVDYDGRPIFGMSCIEFTEMMMGIDKNIEIIPAHIWTPWFSLFGANSGFDSIKECFGGQLKHIHAIETGMSSDPPMNWRLSQLDSMSIVSFSDSHSFWPWRLGREAALFDFGSQDRNKNFTYKDIINAIRTQKNLYGTIEVDPGYGKYHFTGHRNCNVCLSPSESLKLHDVCPSCGRKLTVGVAERVEELADREEGYKRKDAKQFYTLVPLSEIIAASMGKSPATKTVWAVYYKLIEKFDSEFNILLNVPKDELEKHIDKKLANIIIKNREGKIKVKPGYDGVYGVPEIKGIKIEAKADACATDINADDANNAPVKARRVQKSLIDF